MLTETTTDEELFDIFEEIITTILKDGHSFVSYNNGEREAVYGLGNSEELQNTLFDNTPSKVNIVPSSANNPYISYGTLVDEPDIGFIHTKSFEPVVQDDAEFDNFKAIVDEALAALQSKESDNGKFIVPSLKNISMRPPYMHDGRFGTLEEVIEHYSSGIQNHPNLISPLVNSNGEVGQFNFTQEEKEALIAFLNTLTDNEMLADEKYSNPFE